MVISWAPSSSEGGERFLGGTGRSKAALTIAGCLFLIDLRDSVSLLVVLVSPTLEFLGGICMYRKRTIMGREIR